MMLQLAPVECRPRSALMHWESLRGLGMSLGDVVAVWAEETVATPLLLSVWASGAVAVGRVGLSEEARAALGPVSRIRLSVVGAAVSGDASLVELVALSAAQEDDLGLWRWHGTDGSLSARLLGAHVRAGCVVALRLHGAAAVLRVVRARGPQGEVPSVGAALRVGARTQVKLTSLAAQNPVSVPAVTATRVPGAVAGTPACSTAFAGLERQLDVLRGAAGLPLCTPHVYERLGIAPSRGVLLHGPPGTGKTLLVRTFALEQRVPVVDVDLAHLLSATSVDAEGRLIAAFADARRRAPAIVFLDEVDALGARGAADGCAESRLLATLLCEMDGARAPSAERVVVIGATNRPDALDASLRRAGRFDREMEVGVPSEDQRRSIAIALLAHTPHALSGARLDELAACTAGFVGADLAALHRHAALAALARPVDPAAASEYAAGLAGEAVGWADVQRALQLVKPSGLRELALEVPRVSWDDIGGQPQLKQTLREAVDWPLRHADAFARMGVRPPRGVLLYGPPGCSKTLAAKALASEARTNLLAVKGPELFSKWVGESERAVAALFRKARAAAPAIIFFDEIDALATSRTDLPGTGGVGHRVLSQLLHEIDGIQPLQAVLVVAATNRPDRVDAALLRPGRFDTLVHVSLPDGEARAAILAIHTRHMPLATDFDRAALVAATDGYSGAELAAVCREAALLAMEESVNAVHVASAHFNAALQAVRPRTTPAMLDFFAAVQARGVSTRVPSTVL